MKLEVRPGEFIVEAVGDPSPKFQRYLKLLERKLDG